MGTNIKRMCKVDRKLIDEFPEEFFAVVNKPKYICKKCLRVACDKTYLCDPAKLKKKKKK